MAKETVPSSKFIIEIGGKSYSNCSMLTAPRRSVAPIPEQDADGRKGTPTNRGNVSVSSVTFRKPFEIGDSTLKDLSDAAIDPNGDYKATAGITVLGQDDKPKYEMTLHNAWISDYGLSDLAKGSNAQLMEEVTLTVESVEYKIH